LFDYLWQAFLEPALSDNKEAAHALALAQHRIIEIVRNKPESLAYTLSLLNSKVVRSYKGNGVYRRGFKQFEARLAETLKTGIKVELTATKKQADVRPVAKPASQNGE